MISVQNLEHFESISITQILLLNFYRGEFVHGRVTQQAIVVAGQQTVLGTLVLMLTAPFPPFPYYNAPSTNLPLPPPSLNHPLPSTIPFPPPLPFCLSLNPPLFPLHSPFPPPHQKYAQPHHHPFPQLASPRLGNPD